jgi:hypothetical protein
MDFYLYYAAAKLVLEEKNPWNYLEYGGEVRKYLDLTGQYLPPFPAPPWGCWTWLPLGFLDPHASLVVWQSLLLLFPLLIPFLCRDGFRPPPSLFHYLMAIALTYTSFPWIKTFALGQISIVPMLVVWGVTCAFNRQQVFWLGLLIALSTTRLQLFLPLYCFLMGSSRVYRNIWFGLGGLWGMLLQFSFMLLVVHPSPAEILSTLTSASAVKHVLVPTVTIPSVIGWLTNSFELVLLISIFAAVLTPLLCWRLGLDEADSLEVCLVSGLIFSIYAWGHDYLLLAPLAVNRVLSMTRPESIKFALLGGMALSAVSLYLSFGLGRESSVILVWLAAGSMLIGNPLHLMQSRKGTSAA